MPVFIVQAVQRSDDGARSVRVANRWPHEAAGLEEAMAYIDATPSSFDGWDNANTFEVVTLGGQLLASRPLKSADWTIEAAKEAE